MCLAIINCSFSVNFCFKTLFGGIRLSSHLSHILSDMRIKFIALISYG